MSHDRLPPIFEGYAPDKLERMVAILERTSDGRPVDPSEVEERLVELIHAVGRARDGTEQARLWHEIQAELAPDHAQLRERFNKLAKAENPLDPAFCTGDLARELHQLIRAWWSSRWRRAGRGEPDLHELDWPTLTAAEQDEIRAMCRHLARYHHSFVRRGRQQKDDLDTILEELAEWFLRWTGQNRKTIDDVPYSINSRFITFVVEALEPIGMYFEVSAKALSRRWERRVRHARTGWPRAETAEAFGDDA